MPSDDGKTGDAAAAGGIPVAATGDSMARRG